MLSQHMSRLIFKHLVDIPNSGCVFCSTEEESTGRKKLYLIFNGTGSIYWRNGLKGTWTEVSDQVEYSLVRSGFNCAEVNKIPRFRIENDEGYDIK